MRSNDMIVAIGVIVVLAGVVLLFAPGGDQRIAPTRGMFEAQKVECMSNVRNIVGLIEVSYQDRYPAFRGANLILFLVKRGELEDQDALTILFCPGDENESLKKAGGTDAYTQLDIRKRGVNDHLTSYAGRDQLNKQCAANKRSSKAVALVCDDSEDHHYRQGFVIGYTGGAVKWREKVEDWQVEADATVLVGEGTQVKELECLRVD